MLDVYPGEIIFDNNVVDGVSQAKIIEIKNVADRIYAGKVTLDVVLETDENSNDFKILPNKLTLEPGESKKAYIIFNPKSLGNKDCKLLIRNRTTTRVEEVVVAANCVGKPDLVPEILVSENTIKSGHFLWGKVYLKTKNIGEFQAGTHKVKYYLSTTPSINQDAILFAEETVPILNPNETHLIIRPNNHIIPESIPTGKYYIIGEVDVENNIDEEDETNNTVFSEIYVEQTLPSLTVTDVLIPNADYQYPSGGYGIYAGSSLKQWALVENASDEKLFFTFKTYLSEDVYYDSKDDILVTQEQVVVRGNYQIWTLNNITIPQKLSPGRWYLLYRAYEESLPGYDSRIPVTWKSLQVFERPDLEIYSTDDYLLPMYPNENLQARISIRNNGNGVTPEVRIRCYLSTDTEYDESDFRIGLAHLPELTPEHFYENVICDVTIPHYVEPGTYYILYFVDFDRIVDEVDEANNWAYSQIQVESYPDLYVYNLDISDNVIDAGSSVMSTCRVVNLDHGNAPESILKFYLSDDHVLGGIQDRELAEILIPPLAYNEENIIAPIELMIPKEVQGGQWYIYAKIDGKLECPYSWCNIKESNESNNMVYKEVAINRKPDLYFGSAMYLKNQDNAVISTTTEGSEIYLSYEVIHSNGDMYVLGSNTGLSFAGANSLTCYLSSNTTIETSTDIVLGTKMIESSYGNDYFIDNLTLNIPENLLGEQWYIIACIDIDNEVNERDENNNLWVHEISVSDNPDLAIQNGKVKPNILIQGIDNIVDFSGIMKNLNPNLPVEFSLLQRLFFR
ncbi:MAG: hypothetical protein HC831_15755 [Chloroflexia bacterium]|nr:hypothetical protein [Chloroflexia bacterium]